MRNAFASALYDEATMRKNVHVVVADISPAGAMEKFSTEYPDRFINVGVAEQTMIGICAGLALRGRQPFAYTIAPFSLYRPFEFVRDDLCYQNLPVTVVGMGAGLIYSTLGGTHHAQEDAAIASAIPNMQVVAPCDPLECADVVRWCATQKNGPVYLRLGKVGEPILTKEAEPWRFGRIRFLHRGMGGDVCILAYGPIMNMASQAAHRLRSNGSRVSLVSVHTLKPLDRDGISEVLSQYDRVIVIEEHSPHGGLAAMVKQIAWETRADCELDAFTLKDEFIHCYGSHEDILAEHGLSVDSICARVLQ